MMGQSNEDILFCTEFKAIEDAKQNSICLVYKGQELIVKTGSEDIVLPNKEECSRWGLALENSIYLGEMGNKAYFALEINKKIEILEGFEWSTLSDRRWIRDQQLYFIGIKAKQLLGWDKGTQYCGSCGNKNNYKVDERAKKCPNCGRVEYPRISPAIIVGIRKGDELLMAHNAGFKDGLYSIIAGFVEQGETLEQTVKREVYEEVGIKVKNIKYFASKPWSSLDSLMLGFTAEYESGEIKIDGKEITDAGWYSKKHLPPILPDEITIAREIINHILKLEEDSE